jgi:hypothetical protein
MSMMGDFFTGKSMVGGDAEESTNPFSVRITGKTRFSGRLLVTQTKLAANILGRTLISATFSRITRPELTGVIIGETIFTGNLPGHHPITAVIIGNTQVTATLHIPSITHLTGNIVGRSRFQSPGFATGHVLDFQGDVGAQGERSLIWHGEVLSGTGAVYPNVYEDERQPVPHFV